MDCRSFVAAGVWVASFLRRAAFAVAVPLLAVVNPASAQSLEGEWTNTPSSCGIYSTNNTNIHVRSDGYLILESFCSFTGGFKGPAAWRMRASCGTEGNADELDIGVELRVVGGRLRLDVEGRTYYYAQKCGAAGSTSPARTYWDHNGSVTYLVAEGNRRRFYYSQPRGGMQGAGVVAGTLLFDGRAVGNGYEGTAYIFNAGCGAYPYHVSGPILDNYRRVQLRGSAPRIGVHCDVVAHVTDVMTFVLEPGQ